MMQYKINLKDYKMIFFSFLDFTFLCRRIEAGRQITSVMQMYTRSVNYILPFGFFLSMKYFLYLNM